MPDRKNDITFTSYLVDFLLIIGIILFTISSTLLHLLLIDHTIRRVSDLIIQFFFKCIHEKNKKILSIDFIRFSQIFSAYKQNKGYKIDLIS